jgi:hypothetical protein
MRVSLMLIRVWRRLDSGIRSGVRNQRGMNNLESGNLESGIRDVELKNLEWNNLESGTRRGPGEVGRYVNSFVKIRVPIRENSWS